MQIVYCAEYVLLCCVKYTLYTEHNTAIVISVEKLSLVWSTRKHPVTTVPLGSYFFVYGAARFGKDISLVMLPLKGTVTVYRYVCKDTVGYVDQTSTGQEVFLVNVNATLCTNAVSWSAAVPLEGRLLRWIGNCFVLSEFWHVVLDSETCIL